jgi:DNA-binding transcriptional LysR family regulator
VIVALDMNINQLRCFHAVVKAGTFSRAAETLHVSEPAVFVQVRSLERFIGFKLLEKFKKEQTPTEVGKLLYGYAEKIFVLVDEAMSTLNSLRDLKTGCLRIGATRAVCQYLMPQVISLFRDEYPLIRIHLDEGRSEELLQGVLSQHYEIAIIARVKYPDEVNAIPFTKDDVLVVVSPESKLLAHKTVSLEQLAAEPVICTDNGSAIRGAVEKAFARKGLKPEAVIEAANMEFIKRLVRQNRGFSFLSSVSVRDEIRRGELATLPLDDDNFSIYVDLVHVKGKILSPVASTFLNFLQENRNLTSLRKLIDTISRRGSARGNGGSGDHRRVRGPT